MYNSTLEGISARVPQSVQDVHLQPTRQYKANAETPTQLPYYPHFNDTLTGYNTWSNEIENTTMIQYIADRQDILSTWQKDTPEKIPYNRQMIDKVKTYFRDKDCITQ